MKKKSNNSFITDFLSSDGYIVINKKLIQKTDLVTTVLLCELCSEYNYYKKNNRLVNDEWFYSTSPNIEENTGLSRKLQDKAIKKLIELEFVKTKVMGMPSKKYFSINFDKIIDFLDKKTTKNQGCPNGASKDVPMGQARMSQRGKQGCPNRTSKDVPTGQARMSQWDKQGCPNGATNNNNITIINNNNNKQSIISGKDGLVAQNDYAQFVDKINLKELLKQYKEPSTDRANLENILKIIQNLFNQKNNKVISVGKNEEVTTDYFKDYLIKNYSSETIEYILESYKNNTTKIKNIKKYITTMLYNAPQTIDLYYYNSVESDKNNINKRPNDYYENLFLEKSKAKAYGSSK